MNSQFIVTACMDFQNSPKIFHMITRHNTADVWWCLGAHPCSSISNALIGGCGLCNCELEHTHLAHSTNIMKQE